MKTNKEKMIEYKEIIMLLDKRMENALHIPYVHTANNEGAT